MKELLSGSFLEFSWENHVVYHFMGLAVMIIFTGQKAVAFSESVTTTLIVISPGSNGVSENVLVPGSNEIHEGNGLPLINAAE